MTVHLIVTGMNLRDLNVLLLHYPYMSNPRYCLEIMKDIWGVSRKLATFEQNDCNRHESQRFECVIIALSIYV